MAVIVSITLVILTPSQISGQARLTTSGREPEVGTILANQCVSCHGPEQKEGGLDLTRRASALYGGKSGTAIVPGEPDDSLLVDRIAEGEMPPKGAFAAPAGCGDSRLGEGWHPLCERAADSSAGWGGLVVAAAARFGVTPLFQ